MKVFQTTENLHRQHKLLLLKTAPLPVHNRLFLFPIWLWCPDCDPKTEGGGMLAGSLWTADKPVGSGSLPTASTGL